MKKLYRLLRVCAWTLGALLAVLGVLYGFRAQLVAPWIEEIAEEELAAVLQAEVRIDGLGGDWLGELSIDQVEVRGGRGPLVELLDGKISVQLSAWSLISGDLAGLRRLDVHAGSLKLRPDAAVAAGPAAEESPASGPLQIPESLLAMLPEGAQVQCESFELQTAQGSESGSLELVLQPREGDDREVQVRALGARVRGSTSAMLRGHAHVEVADPDRLVRLFVSNVPLKSRRVKAELDFDLSDAIALRGSLAIEGVRHEDRVFPETRAKFAIEDGLATIAELQLHGPGLVLAGEQLCVPLANFDQKALAKAGSGSFRLEISDFEPWREFLPREVVDLLPLRTELVASTEAGRLRVERQDLHGQGFDLEAREIEIDLPALVEGRLPQLDCRKLRLELRDLGDHARHLPAELRSVLPITGNLHAQVDGGVLSIAPSELRGRGLRVEIRGGSMPLLGDAALSTRPGRLSLLAHLDRDLHVEYEAIRGLRAAGTVELGIEGSFQRPRVQAKARIASADWQGHAVRDLVLEADFAEGDAARTWTAKLATEVAAIPGKELGLPFEGLDRPARLTLEAEGSLQDAAPMHVLAKARVQDFAPRNGPVVELETEAEMRGDLVTLRTMRLSGGFAEAEQPFEITAKGSASLGQDGALDLALGPCRLPVEHFGFLAGLPLARGELTLAARLSGTRAQPIAKVDLDGEIQHLFGTQGERWPILDMVEAPGDPIRIAVSARSDRERIFVEKLSVASDRSDAIHISGAGGLPIRIAGSGAERVPSGDEPLRMTVRLRPTLSAALEEQLRTESANQVEELRLLASIEEQRVAIDELALSGDLGSVAGKLELNAGLGTLIWDAASLDATGIQGELHMDTIQLSRLPARRLGLGQLRGVLNGHAKIAGTLASLQPELELRLQQGALKAVGVPRIEKLEATVTLRSDSAEIVDVRGELGAAPFTIRGKVDTSGKKLWSSWQDAALHLDVEGERLLLARQDGVKVRGDVDVQLRGTVDHPKVGGRILLRNSKVVKSVSLLPDFRSRSGASVESDLVPFRLGGSFGERLSFDLAIETESALRLRTGIVDCNLFAHLRLRGQANKPFLVGSVTTNQGWLRLPGVNLRISNLLLNFPEGTPYVGEILVSAAGRRFGYRIDLSVSGDTRDPQISLTSIPALPPESVLVLATTGQLPKDLEDDKQSSLMAAGGFLANELLKSMFGSDSVEAGESWVDRVTISAGEEVSENGVESIRVEYDIDGFWFVQAERDVYEEYNADLGIRIRLD